MLLQTPEYNVTKLVNSEVPVAICTVSCSYRKASQSGHDSAERFFYRELLSTVQSSSPFHFLPNDFAIGRSQNLQSDSFFLGRSRSDTDQRRIECSLTLFIGEPMTKEPTYYFLGLSPVYFHVSTLSRLEIRDLLYMPLS